MRVDFTSARFLGLGAPGPPVAAPTLGKPAALAEPPGADRLARMVATGQRAQAGLVARSTLHALCDILAVRDAAVPVLIDEHCYPITLWAARAALQEGTMIRYHHRDARHVQRLLARLRGPATIVADAWCGSCLRPAPLAALAAAADGSGGELVIDDSLAFGVMGRSGLGTPTWAGLDHGRVLWVASAGKSLGAPITLITGPARRIERLRRDGPQRTHSSPASAGDIAVVSAALTDPRLEDRRHRLARRTHYFRAQLAAAGLAACGAPLPVVGLSLPGARAEDVVAQLRLVGIQALATRSSCRPRPTTIFCVRADHTERDLDAAVAALAVVGSRAAS